MSTILTPRFPGVIDQKGSDSSGNQVKAALPIEGARQWKPWAQGALWSLMKGATLVAANGHCVVGGTMSASLAASPGDITAYRYYAWPNKQNVARLWTIGLMATGSGYLNNAQAFGEFWNSDGDPIGSWSLQQFGMPCPTTFRVVENLQTPTAAPGEISINVVNDALSTASVVVTGITCQEIYRVRPDYWGTDDLPIVDPTSCQSGAPITSVRGDGADPGERRSVDGLGQLVLDPEALLSEARRSCLFSWWNPLGLGIASSSLVSVFQNPIPILKRKLTGYSLYPGELEVEVAVCCATQAMVVRADIDSDNTTDHVDITTGGTSPFAWFTGRMDVDVESTLDLEDNAGLPEGLRGYVDILARRTTGSNGTIYGVCIGEPRL